MAGNAQKESEEERRKRIKEEEERRENEGGWRDCVGALPTHYSGQLYEWPLEGIKKAWNYCRNDRQKEELKQDVLNSFKQAQHDYANPPPERDDGSSWESDLNGMLGRDYYGLEIFQYPDEGLKRVMANLNSRQRDDFKKYLLENGRSYNYPITPAPVLSKDLADFFKV